MDDIQFAYLNECGDYSFSFDKNDVSTHFILVAILVKSPNKEWLEAELVRSFHTEELDTIQILNNLKDLPFSVYAYVIDKRKIREDFGIMHKTPFIKYLNRMIYDDLNRTFEQLDITAEEQGTKPFLKEFKNYIGTKSIPDLFNYSTFGFNNNQSESILRLADLIAATLAKGYERTKYTAKYHSYIKIIKNKIAAINLLPLDYKNFLHNYTTDYQNSKHDEIIIKQAVNLAYKYIEKHRKSEEEDEKLRIDFLKFLLFNLKENPDEYVYTEEILENLNAIRDIKMNPHNFRSNIVSKLRDSGLLIASSNKGYKLPVCLNDLYDFVNLSSLTIHPMIQRISKCRDQILLATNNEIDILEQKEYEYLKKFIEMQKMTVT
ncbi:hypothetical protein ACIFOT_05570 [Neobacillus sp. NRS-1170]|uniref:hypothetical protein n=1 Tax=Neobacillus sp. NRS-1170 TaxID=3233898 RepID=UPI003D2806AD